MNANDLAKYSLREIARRERRRKLGKRGKNRRRDRRES